VADYDEVIAPGATGNIHTVVDTATFEGGISKAVTVLTDDAKNPRLMLTIKALVEPMIFVKPGYARYVQPQKSAPGKVEELIFCQDFDNLEITDVKSPYDFLSVDYRKATEDEREEHGVGNQWVVTLTLDYDKAPVGALADYVYVVTNHPKQKDVPIPVSGFVRPMVVVTPDEARLGQVDVSEAPQVASLLLKNYAQQNIDVSVAGTTVPGLKVGVEPLQEGREYKIILTVDEDVPKGDFDGTIRLNLNHPKMPTLEIPVHGTRL
jgi:hypothetical protein